MTASPKRGVNKYVCVFLCFSTAVVLQSNSMPSSWKHVCDEYELTEFFKYWCLWFISVYLCQYSKARHCSFNSLLV